MPANNTNPETGIRYGLISAQALECWVIEEIQSRGKDLHFLDALEQAEREARAEWEDDDSYRGEYPEASDLVEARLERLGDDWYDDEPVHSFEIDCPGYGVVKGQTAWLGGALLVWIFKSPFVGNYQLCSPCVPNAGDLNNTGDYECYDVPADWRREL